MVKRHIVIGGSSYTGSTLFGLMLGALDGVSNVGESNWLVPRMGEEVDDPSLWSAKAYSEMQQCRLCGEGCEVWTKEVRQDLQRDPAGWYRRIGERMGGDVLISSEKEPANIRPLDPALENTTLVLFKTPFQHWASVSKRSCKTKSLNAAMNTWARIYSEFLDDAAYAPKGGKVFLNIEKFLDAPEPGLKALTSALGLPCNPQMLRYWETKQHYIGGNFNVYDRMRDAPEKLPVKNSLQPVRREDNVAIRAHDAYRVYVALSERSIL